MSEPSSHAESRNWLESLVRQVPGFKGYLEREYRRDSDQLARTKIADGLHQCKVALDRCQQTLVDAGQLDMLPACERLRTRLDVLQSRVKGTMRGYSGFFDFVRVDEELLDQVYQLDMSLIDDAAALQRFGESLTAGAPLPEVLTKLSAQIDDLARRFDRRSELLEGLN